jgi:hypothetical protein
LTILAAAKIEEQLILVSCSADIYKVVFEMGCVMQQILVFLGLFVLFFAGILLGSMSTGAGCLSILGYKISWLWGIDSDLLVCLSLE